MAEIEKRETWEEIGRLFLSGFSSDKDTIFAILSEASAECRSLR